MQERPPDFAGLLRALTQADARFVLIRGFAMIAHGSDYETKDVDFAFVRDPANLKAIVQALRPFSPRPWGFPEDLPFVWDEMSLRNSTILTLETGLGRVDFLAEPPGAPPFETLYHRSPQIELFGMMVRVASIDDQIAMKQAAGRVKDQLHLLELQALKKLIEERTD